MSITKKRLKNSVRFTPEEHQKLREYYSQFHTDSDFAEALKMDRVTLKRILDYGSGKQNNIVKIQKRLKRIFADA